MIDDVDYRLIRELQEDALQSRDGIAKKIGISEASVRRRIRNLRNSGVIHLTCLPNPKKVGFHTAAMVGLNVVPGAASKLAKQLESHPYVTFVGTSTGRFDMMLWVYTRSPSSLAQFLRDDLPKEGHIVGSETLMVLDTLKWNHTWLPPLEDSPVRVRSARRRKNVTRSS